MATDVDVQYFSHLNGLTLGNNWGDLIRLLDKALVTGIDFTQITSASIDAQGDVHITLYAAHNAMLFQVVELSGFSPAPLNQKYRIKGVPSATELILKPHTAIVETSITTVGAGKLASLGYEIIFRDTNDVKRVYRAKNPTAQHPFIRIDESLTSPDGTTGVYTSTYAKYAMVGLLENMTHIDDYENLDVLQLPFDSVDPAKNWKITGTGTGVVRGWSRWYWSRAGTTLQNIGDTTTPGTSNASFSIVGDQDAFYLLNSFTSTSTTGKTLKGCGLLNRANPDSVAKDWFLMTILNPVAASTTYRFVDFTGGNPLLTSVGASGFFMPSADQANPLQAHRFASPILPDFESGYSNLYLAMNVGALEIAVTDVDKYLRGTLKHVAYSGNKLPQSVTTPIISGASMYVWDKCLCSSRSTAESEMGGLYFHIGELE
ncbi:hypothetical protein [Acinetobacter sp. YH12058]|uniref:hypothetical protein n=1 Tax=Acinetobacter sp. YH12058 TaxID=2601058 RepID=UPI0015D262FB|nr:hypothetical protein [Acinetobacter sp. YH12058]